MSLLEEIAALELESRKLDPPEEDLRRMMKKAEDVVLTSLKHSRGDGVPHDPAWRYSGPNAGKELEDDGLDDEPKDLDEILQLLDRNVLREGGNHSSPRFFGWVPGPCMYPAAIGDYIVAAASRFAGYYLANPGAVRMENMLVRWAIQNVAGYDTKTAFGFLSSGASMATVSAFLCARDKHEVLTNPDVPAHRRTVYITQEVHACAQKALWLTGACAVVQRYVPSDDSCRMIVSALEAMVKEDVAAGLVPWMVVGTAGTVNTGSVDPLEEIAAVAKEYKMWFHVDGAYGGMLKLCPEGQQVLKGLELSDSMAADPHKAMFVPQGTGLLMVRDGAQLKKSHSLSAHYLQPFAEVPDDMISSSSVSPELTKHFRAMRMWLPLKVFGLKSIKAAMSEKILLARYFYDVMSKDDRFQLGPYPDLSIASYRLILPSIGDSTQRLAEENNINDALLQATLRDGSCFITVTTVKGVLWLRICVLQFRCHKADVDQLISVLKREGGALLGVRG